MKIKKGSINFLTGQLALNIYSIYFKFLGSNYCCKGLSYHVRSRILLIVLMERDYKVVYTPKSCNLVAQGLAKMALFSSESQVWIEEVLKKIKNLCNCFVLLKMKSFTFFF